MVCIYRLRSDSGRYDTIITAYDMRQLYNFTMEGLLVELPLHHVIYTLGIGIPPFILGVCITYSKQSSANEEVERLKTSGPI